MDTDFTENVINIVCWVIFYWRHIHSRDKLMVYEQKWSDGGASGWSLPLCWQSLKATNQELVAGVLVVFLYIQGLDLGVGDAGTVLVDGEEHRWDMPVRTRVGAEEDIQIMEWRQITQNVVKGQKRKQQEDAEGTYRMILF